LPKDGNLTGLSTIIMPLDDDDSVNDSIPLDDDTFMSGTFVPMVPRKQTEQNVIIGKAFLVANPQMKQREQYSGHMLRTLLLMSLRQRVT
jgi:hypothetical protein